MPKKKGKRKGKKKGGDVKEKRLLTLATDMETYAKVMKTLGDRRLTVVLPDSSEILALIPGRFRKRVWMKVGDVVLVSRRDFQDTKVDIIHKYNTDEVRKLVKIQEVPEFFLDALATQAEDEDGVAFATVEEEAEEEFDFDNL